MAVSVDASGFGAELTGVGYVYLPRRRCSASSVGRISLADFAASSDRLGVDRYMADRGRYRRRCHAFFAANGRALVRKPYQPHFHGRDYNPLNGDVQRWFDRVEPAVAESRILRALFYSLMPLFTSLDGRVDTSAWHSQVHQLRIETSAAEIAGRPGGTA